MWVPKYIEKYIPIHPGFAYLEESLILGKVGSALLVLIVTGAVTLDAPACRGRRHRCVPCRAPASLGKVAMDDVKIVGLDNNWYVHNNSTSQTVCCNMHHWYSTGSSVYYQIGPIRPGGEWYLGSALEVGSYYQIVGAWYCSRAE
jgi:hypothetical protein